MLAVRRLLPLLVLVALVLPAAARAHGSIMPTAAAAGAVQRFVVTVPNALQGGPEIVAVAITAPEGATVESAEARQPRWSARVSGRTVTWEGGPPQGLGEDFAFRARMPESEGTYTFSGRESSRAGAGPPFRLAVTVTRVASAALPPAMASADDGLAWVAIALAGTALLLALGTAIAVAALWRRQR
jgi:hypothetical protein